MVLEQECDILAQSMARMLRPFVTLVRYLAARKVAAPRSATHRSASHRIASHVVVAMTPPL